MEPEIKALAMKLGMSPDQLLAIITKARSGPGAGLSAPNVPGAPQAMDPWAGLADKLNPVGAQTLGGKFTDMVGLTDPNARAFDRPDSLLGAFMPKIMPRKTGVAAELDRGKDVKKINTAAPMTAEAQLAAKKKPTTALGGLLSLFS